MPSAPASTTRSVSSLWPALVLFALCSGCGPVRYLRSIHAAEVRMDAAREANARWQAPYEYYFAEAQYEQARLEAAEASYEDAIRYADTAQEYAARALRITARKQQEEP